MRFTAEQLESTIRYARLRAADTQVKRYVYGYRTPQGGWHYGVYATRRGPISQIACGWCLAYPGERHEVDCLVTVDGSFGRG